MKSRLSVMIVEHAASDGCFPVSFLAKLPKKLAKVAAVPMDALHLFLA